MISLDARLAVPAQLALPVGMWLGSVGVSASLSIIYHDAPDINWRILISRG